MFNQLITKLKNPEMIKKVAVGVGATLGVTLVALVLANIDDTPASEEVLNGEFDDIPFETE